ncbi:MAG TPA: 2-hydroxychromene-2-carboxylate isomerase [Steroidobacteraceae bacterium]|nr:2-hydroxychromene-2-carboxylate isomerase [Steroidobacteraceae bacterium]
MAEARRVTWLYDVVSPFAYLSLPRLAALPPGIEVQAVPVLLAGLLDHFRQLGPAEIASKRRFIYRQAVWRARRARLPMRFPPRHPFNPLAALRLIIAAGSTLQGARTALTAVFRDGRDVSDPAELERLARELGVPDPQARLADPQVKAQLRANTEWAAARGIFGVPTLVVGEEFFWGDDAFEMALDYLEDPVGFQDEAMRAAEAAPIGATRSRTP